MQTKKVKCKHLRVVKKHVSALPLYERIDDQEPQWVCANCGIAFVPKKSRRGDLE